MFTLIIRLIHAIESPRLRYPGRALRVCGTAKLRHHNRDNWALRGPAVPRSCVTAIEWDPAVPRVSWGYSKVHRYRHNLDPSHQRYRQADPDPSASAVPPGCKGYFKVHRYRQAARVTPRSTGTVRLIQIHRRQRYRQAARVTLRSTGTVRLIQISVSAVPPGCKGYSKVHRYRQADPDPSTLAVPPDCKG
jgi:hypothetical protein